MLRPGHHEGPLRSVCRSFTTFAPYRLRSLPLVPRAREPVCNISRFNLAGVAQLELRRFYNVEAAARDALLAAAVDKANEGDHKVDSSVSHGEGRVEGGFRRISVENGSNTHHIKVCFARNRALGFGASDLSANKNTATAAILHQHLPGHEESLKNGSRRHQQNKSASSDTSAEDNMLQSSRTHKRSTAQFFDATLKAEEMRSDAHFRYTAKRIRYDRHKQQKMLRMQLERHPYLRGVSSKVWLDGVLRSLHKVGPVEADTYVRRTEIIPLAAGSKAVFKVATREAVLDILLRTGCNVHPVLRSSRGENSREKDRGEIISNISILNDTDSTDSWFDALAFTGSRLQIRAAIDIIPNMIKVIDTDAGLSTECREVSRDDTQTSAKRSEDFPCFPQEFHRHDIGFETRSSGDGSSNPDSKSNSTSPIFIRVVWARARKQSFAYQEALLRRCSDGTFQASGAAFTLEQLRPPIDSAITFAAYVDDLTNLPPRLLRRRVQTSSTAGEPIHFFRQVITELISLFENSQFQELISNDAAEYALQFLMKYSDYHAAQLVFDALLSNETYTLSNSVFDAMLEAAAKNQDMHNFRWLVSTMARLRVAPSWKTWVCLYDLACRRLTSDNAALVLQRMSSNGVLDVPQALRETVCSNVERDLIDYLLQNHNASLKHFVDWYDKRFGRKGHGNMNSMHRAAVEPRIWLSTSTANRMIKVLLFQGRKSDALEVVRMLEAAGDFPDTVTLNTFLTDARRARNPGAAVATLKQLSRASQNQAYSHPEIVLDELSYANLFDIAWKGRYYNMVRVIWRYACCAGEVMWDVQQRIRQSLLTYLPAPKSPSQTKAACVADIVLHDPQHEIHNSRMVSAAGMTEDIRGLRFSLTGVFYGMAGKFAVGIPDHTISPSRSASSFLQQAVRERKLATLAAVPRTPRDTSHANGEEATSPPSTRMSDPKHASRERQLLDMIRADILATGAFRPLIPFADMLEQALKKDLEWRARGFGMLTHDHFEQLKMLSGSTEAARTKIFADILDEMLSEGLKVPMIVKDPKRDV